MPGKEVIQVFCSDLVASITPSVKRLRAFKKVYTKGFERKTIQLSIPVTELAFVGIDNKWVVEPGDFKISVEKLSADFEVFDKKQNHLGSKSVH